MKGREEWRVGEGKERKGKGGRGKEEGKGRKGKGRRRRCVMAVGGVDAPGYKHKTERRRFSAVTTDCESKICF